MTSCLELENNTEKLSKADKKRHPVTAVLVAQLHFTKIKINFAKCHFYKSLILLMLQKMFLRFYFNF